MHYEFINSLGFYFFCYCSRGETNEKDSGQISQRWKRDTIGSDLKMAEEIIIDSDEPTVACCTQKWFRSGKKRKNRGRYYNMPIKS